MREQEKFLRSIDQLDVIKRYDKLPPVQKRKLIQQIKDLQKNWEGAPSSLVRKDEELNPLDKYETVSSILQMSPQAKILNTHKAACVILAGGLGTRLGSKKPKGLYPIVKKKSLFEILLEQIYFLQKRFKCTIPVAILVSGSTKKETVAFLKKKRFFGLKASQITFLEQKNYPYFDQHKKILVNKKEGILSAPNGNGALLEELLSSQLLKKWNGQGIEFVHVIPVDNPLASPLDTYLMERMIEQKTDVGIKAFQRKLSEKNVGLVLRVGNQVVIKDYTDLSHNLKFTLANGGQYCFRLSFLEKIAQTHPPLKLHWVKKKIKQAVVWKGEKFLLDLVAYSNRTTVVCYPKEFFFAPLKQLTGPDGLKAVQKSLLKRDRLLSEAASQKNA